MATTRRFLSQLSACGVVQRSLAIDHVPSGSLGQALKLADPTAVLLGALGAEDPRHRKIAPEGRPLFLTQIGSIQYILPNAFVPNSAR